MSEITIALVSAAAAGLSCPQSKLVSNENAVSLTKDRLI
jgi:hypothetical protein